MNRGWPKKEIAKIWFHTMRLEIISLLKTDWLIMFGHRIVIPVFMRHKVLEKLHEGHWGISTMKEKANYYVWLQGLLNQIEQYFMSCQSCQRYIFTDLDTHIYFFNISKGQWEVLLIDFTGPYNGSIFFVLVDAYSKWMKIDRFESTSAVVVIKL